MSRAGGSDLRAERLLPVRKLPPVTARRPETVFGLRRPATPPWNRSSQESGVRSGRSSFSQSYPGASPSPSAFRYELFIVRLPTITSPPSRNANVFWSRSPEGLDYVQ